MMFRYSKYLIFLIIWILNSCSTPAIHPCIYPPFYFETTIKKDTNFITNQYQFVYGIGKNNQLITRDSQYKYYEYFSYSRILDSFYFQLPANIHKDTVFYCLVDKNLNKDTVGIAYTKKILVDNKRHCRDSYAKITSSNIFFISKNFLKDSCRIEIKPNSSHNLILFKK